MEVNFSTKIHGETPICIISLKLKGLPEESAAKKIMSDLFPDTLTSDHCISDTPDVRVSRHEIRWSVSNRIVMIKIQYSARGYAPKACQQCVQSDVGSIAETLKTAFSVFD